MGSADAVDPLHLPVSFFFVLPHDPAMQHLLQRPVVLYDARWVQASVVGGITVEMGPWIVEPRLHLIHTLNASSIDDKDAIKEETYTNTVPHSDSTKDAHSKGQSGNTLKRPRSSISIASRNLTPNSDSSSSNAEWEPRPLVHAAKVIDFTSGCITDISNTIPSLRLPVTRTRRYIAREESSTPSPIPAVSLKRNYIPKAGRY
jgi:hypothetical protein